MNTPIIVATASQAIFGLEHQSFIYADGMVEDALGTDLVSATSDLNVGDRVMVVTPTGGILWAYVVQDGREVLVRAAGG